VTGYLVLSTLVDTLGKDLVDSSADLRNAAYLSGDILLVFYLPEIGSNYVILIWR